MGRKTNRVLVTTQEEIDLINEDNKELMEDFLEYLKATDHSLETLKVYRSNLNIFFVYMMKHFKNKNFEDLKKKDLIKWQNYLLENNLSPARIKVIRSTLSSLSDYIENILADDDDRYENFRNIINKIPAPNANTVREKTILDEKDCKYILDTLIKREQYQIACAFALANASGRRKSELLRIKRSYIKEDYLMFGCLYKTPEKIKTKGRGKVGKLLNVYILKPKFKKYYDLWMEQREKLGVPDDIDEIFVVKKKDGYKPANTETFNYYAKIIEDIIQKPFYWHSQRHYFVTELCKNNIPSEVIKDIIGWESAEMIGIYRDLSVDSELGKYFNANGIKKVKESSLLNIE